MYLQLTEQSFMQLEVAMMLNVSKEEVSGYLKTGEIKGFSYGDRVRILRRDLLNYLNYHADSYLSLIAYIEDEFPVDGNEEMGFCKMCGFPLTEQNFVTHRCAVLELEENQTKIQAISMK